MDPEARATLLYDAYVAISEAERADICAFLTESCSRVGLVGRIRVALDGLNTCLGGTVKGLQSHVDNMQAHAIFGPLNIDFKIALSDGPRSEAATKGCGFDG